MIAKDINEPCVPSATQPHMIGQASVQVYTASNYIYIYQLLYKNDQARSILYINIRLIPSTAAFGLDIKIVVEVVSLFRLTSAFSFNFMTLYLLIVQCTSYNKKCQVSLNFNLNSLHYRLNFRYSIFVKTNLLLVAKLKLV